MSVVTAVRPGLVPTILAETARQAAAMESSPPPPELG